MSVKGLISRIDRYAIHDGPGVRTLIFLKGCPLHCLWCSSPETQRSSPELTYDPSKCIACRRCLGACCERAMALKGGRIAIERTLCTGCGDCTTLCPTGALELVGRYMSCEEVLEYVERDNTLHRRTNGGITVSGGEPLLQARFVLDLLDRCRHRSVTTAMETSGYGAWEEIEQILSVLDYLFIDVKVLDESQHRQYTGVSNVTILANLARISQFALSGRVAVTVRVPIVPGHNDDVENIKALAENVADLPGILGIELIPYHRFGLHRYTLLGKPYQLSHIREPGTKRVEALNDILCAAGLVDRGGLRFQR